MQRRRRPDGGCFDAIRRAYGARQWRQTQPSTHELAIWRMAWIPAAAPAGDGPASPLRTDLPTPGGDVSAEMRAVGSEDAPTSPVHYSSASPPSSGGGGSGGSLGVGEGSGGQSGGGSYGVLGSPGRSASLIRSGRSSRSVMTLLLPCLASRVVSVNSAWDTRTAECRSRLAPLCRVHR